MNISDDLTYVEVDFDWIEEYVRGRAATDDTTLVQVRSRDDRPIRAQFSGLVVSVARYDDRAFARNPDDADDYGLAFGGLGWVVSVPEPEVVRAEIGSIMESHWLHLYLGE